MTCRHVIRVVLNVSGPFAYGGTLKQRLNCLLHGTLYHELLWSSVRMYVRMSACRGVEVWLHLFSTFLLDMRKWLTALPGRFPPGKESPVFIERQAGWATEPLWTLWLDVNDKSGRQKLQVVNYWKKKIKKVYSE